MDLSLRLNCAFARVAVKQFSCIKRGMSRLSINRQKRKDEFQLLFAGVEEFCDLHGDGDFGKLVVILVGPGVAILFLTVLVRDGTQTRVCVLNIVRHFLLLIGKLCHCPSKRNIQ